MFFHLPNPSNTTTESVFYYSGPNSWKVWKKPSGVNFIYALLIGGGGGGGGGGGVSGTNASGGAGGASASITKAMFPAFVVPDQLYVSVGGGGAGGAGGVYLPSPATNNDGQAGSTGGFSFISLNADSSSTLNVLLSSGNYSGSGAGGGNGGTTTTSTGGTAGVTPFNSTLGLFSDCFIWDFILGKKGLNGLTTGFLNDVDPLITPCSMVLPGAPGGRISSTNVPDPGSGILSHSFLSAISGGAAGSPGSPGASGQSFLMNINHPMFFTSGTGGGASSGTAGKGGDGSYGCGGGGGGTGLVGGKGGKGGDGLVIIVAW